MSMNFARQVEEVVKLLAIVGCVTINVAIVLRGIAPERWPKVWTCFVVAAILWCGVAVWQAYEIWMVGRQMQLDAARGIQVIGPLGKFFVWWLFLVPSIPALILLLWFSPRRYKQSLKGGHRPP
jgi:hypothetical protein